MIFQIKGRAKGQRPAGEQVLLDPDTLTPREVVDRDLALDEGTDDYRAWLARHAS